MVVGAADANLCLPWGCCGYIAAKFAFDYNGTLNFFSLKCALQTHCLFHTKNIINACLCMPFVAGFGIVATSKSYLYLGPI